MYLNSPDIGFQVARVMARLPVHQVLQGALHPLLSMDGVCCCPGACALFLLEPLGTA